MKMSFNNQRKEEINWITAEAMKLHEAGYGTMHDCVTRATQTWKREKKIREKLAMEKVFNCFGVNEEIIKNEGLEESWKPLYESYKKAFQEVGE